MQKLLSRIKNVIFDVRFTPVILLLLCLLSYGIFIPVTGFFIDDWYIMWFKHFFGALQFPAYFALDRPLMGYFYPVANFLLAGSESPIVWGLFAVILRWLSTLALWGMLKTLWPKSDLQNCFVVLLAAVFPGFTQHWFVVIYSYFYTCLAFFFLSITFMIKAVREPKRFWIYYPLSFLLGFYSMTSEFFFGLELIRPIVLYFEFKRTDQVLGKQLLSIMKYWCAFLVSFIGFGIWRVFFFVSVNHQIEITATIANNSVNTLLSILQALYQSIVNSVISSWLNPFYLSNYPEKGILSVLIPVTISVVFIGLYIWLSKANKINKLKEKQDIYSWRREAFLLSIFSLVFAILPFLSAGLTVDYLGFNNRFLLAYLFGSCLLLVVIFESFDPSMKKEIFIFSLLVAVAVGYQISNANIYKNVWLRQKEFFWQLDWRIPGLQPGTTLLTYDFPANNDLYSGNALSAQLNWTYSDRVINRQVDYQFIILNSGQEDLIKSLGKNIPININFRTYSFEGNTSESIYILPPSLGCLRILDQDLTPPQTVITDLTDDQSKGEILSGSALTDLNLILNDGTSPNHPPLQVLGSEIPHTWCYYFEKADLARQFGDYNQVISLLNAATAKGYAPGVGSEWYPFIDAYARSGDWQNAEQITKNLAEDSNPTVQTGLCHLWEKLANDFTDPNSSKISAEMTTTVLNCGN